MIVKRPSDKEALGLACQYLHGQWHAYNPRHVPVTLDVAWTMLLADEGFYDAATSLAAKHQTSRVTISIMLYDSKGKDA